MGQVWIDCFDINLKSAFRNFKSVISIGALLFALCSVVEAQQTARVPRIGFLLGLSSSADSPRVEAFRQGLRDLGYVEGKNIVIEFRYADAKFELLPGLATELVRRNVDVLVVSTTPAVQAAKNATRTIPIVFFGVTDPVAAGLVDSLARPGGNITGFTNIAAVLAGKRLELLKEIVSKLSRVLRCCGIHRIQALHPNGKKASCRHENWVCSFIPWK